MGEAGFEYTEPWAAEDASGKPAEPAPQPVSSIPRPTSNQNLAAKPSPTDEQLSPLWNSHNSG